MRHHYDLLTDTLIIVIGFLALSVLLFLTHPAHAHDQWDNGQPVPDYIKTSCCGPADVHHIPNAAIRIMADGYHIDGLTTVVPFAKAIPSPDTTYWGFWNPTGEPSPYIFCFFAPSNGS